MMTRLRAGFEVLGRSLALGKDPGAFERHIDPEPAPGQFGRVALGGHRNLAAADIHPAFAGGDLARKAAVNTVVAQQMGVGLDRAEIVDADDFDVVAPALASRPHHQPANAAKTVDRYPYRHGPLLPKAFANL